MSGRGVGFYAGYTAPGFMNGAPGGGRWAGRGWCGHGGGRGFRNKYYATGLTGWQRAGVGVPGGYAPPVMTSEQELSALRGQVKLMEGNLRGVQERITELEKEEKGQ